MRKTTVSAIVNYVRITFGTAMLSAGVYFFKIPNGFATGGVSGIGTILGRTAPMLTSAQWITLVNVLLLIVGLIFLGKEKTVKTLFCSLLFSLMMLVLGEVCPVSEPITNEPLLELCYAMLLTSIGSAVIFNCGSSSGGTDIIALILKKYTSLNVGKALLITDFLIAGCSFFTFGITAGLFSMLGLFAKAYIVDAVIENISSFKYFVVITDKAESVNQYILRELHHGATTVEGYGAYSHNKKVMIHTVCKRIEAIRLRRSIREIDPNAFIVITTTSEIIGRGFRSV